MAASKSEWRVRAALVVMALLVVGAIVAVHFVMNKTGKNAPERTDLLVGGRKYLIGVTEATLPPRKASGRRWDVGGSAPDCYVEIWWHGNRICKSSVVLDSLVPVWPERDLSLVDTAKSGSIRARLNAGVIVVKAGETVTVKLVDSDIMSDDDIDEHEIPLGRLKVGDNRIEGKRTSFNLRLTPMGEGDR